MLGSLYFSILQSWFAISKFYLMSVLAFKPITTSQNLFETLLDQGYLSFNLYL